MPEIFERLSKIEKINDQMLIYKYLNNYIKSLKLHNLEKVSSLEDINRNDTVISLNARTGDYKIFSIQDGVFCKEYKVHFYSEGNFIPEHELFVMTQGFFTKGKIVSGESNLLKNINEKDIKKILNYADSCLYDVVFNDEIVSGIDNGVIDIEKSKLISYYDPMFRNGQTLSESPRIFYKK